ncbi:hypothetical protein GRI89_08420 [Altererythrobacter salegens]|uniref:Uncharacterized protein n=1 Tax=Croceibacterium salegens TaxID=1737568 RepID=A0A6I4SU24_9SPHN|nr:hypothetical protein [Croceibacterium salegens]MXO59564.1 hypothetical protein [Croceibacterium salegens]
MIKAILLAAPLALAACNQASEEAAPATEATVAPTAMEESGVVDPSKAGFEAVAPGDYEVTRSDGTVDQLTVHPGMTWSRVNSDGSAAGGTIFMQDGKTCFVTEGVEGHRCFTDGPPEPDGTMRVTADDGSVGVVRPKAAAPAG